MSTPAPATASKKVVPPKPEAKCIKRPKFENPNPYNPDALSSVHMTGLNVSAAAGAAIFVAIDRTLCIHAFDAWHYHALEGTARCVAVRPFDDETVTVAVAGDTKHIDLMSVNFCAKKKTIAVTARASIGPYNKRLVTLAFTSATTLIFGDKFGEVQQLTYAHENKGKGEYAVTLPSSPTEASFVVQHLSILTAMKVNDRHLVTSDRDEHIRVCNTARPCIIDGYLWPETVAPSLTSAMELTAEDTLVTGAADGHVRVWDLTKPDCDEAKALIVEANLKPEGADANCSITGVVVVPGLGVLAAVDGRKELQFVAQSKTEGVTAGDVTPLYAIASGSTPVCGTTFVNASQEACGAVLFRDGSVVTVSHLSKRSPVPALKTLKQGLSVAAPAEGEKKDDAAAVTSFPGLQTVSPLEMWSVTVYDPRTTQAKGRREMADKLDEEAAEESARKSARTEEQ